MGREARRRGPARGERNETWFQRERERWLGMEEGLGVYRSEIENGAQRREEC